MLAATIFVYCFATAGVLAADTDTAVIARLGTMEFQAGDLSDFVRLLDPELRKKAMADTELRNRLIGLELARIAVLKEAKAKNWAQRPEVARQIERARDDVIVNNYLASSAALPKEFPSPAEIQAAYELNRDGFMMPRQYRLAQIFVASPKGASKQAEDAAKRKADDLARKARLPNAKFEDLARLNSDHKSSAAKGGDMGWAGQDQILQEIRGEVIGMSVGEISDPIHSAAGWHIVRLDATKPAQPRPLAEVKDTLIAMLRQQKLKDSQQAYVQRLLDKTPVSVNEAGLKKLFESTP